MQTLSIKNNYAGQSIVEVMIAMAIFALIGAVITTMIMGSFTALTQGGEHTQAEALAQEGIEAIRAVRDRDWNGLTCANCIVNIVGNEWVLSDGPNENIGQYTRTITLSDVYRDINNNIVAQITPGAILDEYTKLAEVVVNWNIRDGIVNSAKRTAYLTNWRYSAGGECLAINIDNVCFDDTNSMKSLINISLLNSCSEKITILSTTPTWNNSRSIENVTIDGIGRWDFGCGWNCAPTGRQDSGTILYFGDNILTIDANSSINIDKYEWSGSMSGSEIFLLFTFDDETTALTNNFSPPNCYSNDCAAYCKGFGYAGGNCRASINQCASNGEVNEPGGDGYCVGGASEDTCCCVPATDTEAPAAITDLALFGVTQNSINLSWTAPGDDGSFGIAAVYDVRYLTSKITANNWSSATEATDEPIPSIAGSPETMTVPGLNPNTTYYFAIKTLDEVPNVSELSNIPSAKTQSAITTCNSYCQSQAYSSGTCRVNSKQCSKNGEIYKSDGDQYCTSGGANICCCAP